MSNSTLFPKLKPINPERLALEEKKTWIIKKKVSLEEEFTSWLVELGEVIEDVKDLGGQ